MNGRTQISLFCRTRRVGHRQRGEASASVVRFAADAGGTLPADVAQRFAVRFCLTMPRRGSLLR